MNNKLISFRRKYTVCSAFNSSIHTIMAASQIDALKRGRKCFGHQCYLVNPR